MKQNLKAMIRFVFLLIFFLLVYLNVYADVPILRVGIFLDYKEITLLGGKNLYIHEISSMKPLMIHEKNHPFKITTDSDGIKIGGQLYHSIKGIRVTSEDGGFIQVNNYKYRGEIEIILEHALLNVINVIDIEKYLYGVLQKEISPEWPAEVLEAQAIAARSFALANMNKYIDQGYNICATTNSQAYGGLDCEHPATNKAVNETRGIVAIYKGEPINATYHSDSGGYTENCEDVWGSYVPYLRSIASDYEETVSPPNHSWEYILTEQEIIEKLTQQGFQLNQVDDIIIGEKTEAGRAKSLDICDGKNQKITLKTNDFRLLIGPTLIRSSLFSIGKIEVKENKENKQDTMTPESLSEQNNKVEEKSVKEILKEEKNLGISELISLLNRNKEKEPKPEKVILPAPEVKENKESHDLEFTFTGKGNGHGVGLSQWGAYGMATQGYNHEDILKFYYQGIELKKLY